MENIDIGNHSAAYSNSYTVILEKKKQHIYTVKKHATDRITSKWNHVSYATAGNSPTSGTRARVAIYNPPVHNTALRYPQPCMILVHSNREDCSVYNLLRAFFRFSAPFPALAAVRFTALFATTAAPTVTAGCACATFESAGPSGAGELRRSLPCPTTFVPAFSRPVSSTFDGDT
jgi:hypothetical protein